MELSLSWNTRLFQCGEQDAGPRWTQTLILRKLESPVEGTEHDVVPRPKEQNL